ncbi:MAG: glycosyltransferase family 9 protein [Candidatus Glassbacteria bacterium]|nr:glycosyltransferase family 9 protein [Candidatus Glassbacteria bacterium]
MKKAPSPGKILLVRNDRIGDLVLTTPAMQLLRAHLPQARIDLLCSAYAAPVVQGNPHLDEVLTDRGARDSSDLKSTADMLRSRGYDCVVVMVHSLKNARLVRRARIPLRIGPPVRWYSPLFFNRTVFQQRSRAEKNEAGYNLELLAPLGVGAGEIPPPLVRPAAGPLERAREYLEKGFEGSGPGPLVLVHPGMGGSALNWPGEHWAGLIRLLSGEKKFRVLVTGSEDESGLLDHLAQVVGKDRPVLLWKGGPLEDLIGLIAQADAAVAPSTGPLHLAAALGVAVAGIYSPVRVHHPRRWGPLGPGRKKIFLPQVECPGTYRCLESRCPHWPCMDTVRPEEVLEYLTGILR